MTTSIRVVQGKSVEIEVGLGLPLKAADQIAAEMSIRTRKSHRAFLSAHRMSLQGNHYAPETAIADCVRGGHVVVRGRRGAIFAIWPVEFFAA